MALITPTITELDPFDGSVKKIVWGPMANGDTGVPIALAGYADRSLHVYGTFGAGGTMKWQGSNNSGSTYQDVTDAQGNAFSKAAESLEQGVEVTELSRPNVSAGDGTTSLTMAVVARRANPLRT